MNLKYKIRKEASKRFGKVSSFGNDRNNFIEGGDFIIDFINKNLNNVNGNWWQCLCGEKIFIPVNGCYPDIKYCSYCGKIITAFNKVDVCMDDSVIGTELNKI